MLWRHHYPNAKCPGESEGGKQDGHASEDDHQGVLLLGLAALNATPQHFHQDHNQDEEVDHDDDAGRKDEGQQSVRVLPVQPATVVVPDVPSARRRGRYSHHGDDERHAVAQTEADGQHGGLGHVREHHDRPV